MKIPNQLPQFEQAAVLLVVLGRQEAEVYLLHRGLMALVDHPHERKPEYTDKEGVFKRRGRGIAVISGVARERRDKILMSQELVQDASRRVSLAGKLYRPEAVVFIGPKNIYRGIADRAAYWLRQRCRHLRQANYLKRPPLEILSRLEKELRMLYSRHSK